MLKIHCAHRAQVCIKVNKEIEQWLLPSLNPDHITTIDYFANNR